MPFNPDSFQKQLDTALELFDKQAVAALCDQLINFLFETQEQVPTRTLERILQALRNKRMFGLMQRVADCYIQLGLQTYKIRRQYAQALIDQGIFAAPLSILEKLKAETRLDADNSAAGEHAEATGLIGRIYKQQYVNTPRPEHPRMVELLKGAIQRYQEVYIQDPAGYLWHGINLVALLCRAKRDGIDLKGFPEPVPIAGEILQQIVDLDNENRATAFDFATAIEACIALDRADEALAWLGKYLNNSSADAFELASTLRQFSEVWGLTTDTPLGRQLLPPLNAALLNREGASLTLGAGELDQQRSPGADLTVKFEKLLGTTSFVTYIWYQQGLKSCTAVARIGRDRALGFGTGFLLDGGAVSAEFAGKFVLFTNAHVISDDPATNNGSLYPDQAVVTLEALGGGLELGLDKIIRSSCIYKLDTTILSFDEPTQKKLQDLKDSICRYSIAPRLPDKSKNERVYIIGHPLGGALQLSLQDNVFLDADDRLLHYRTPTVGGSSGSPVFNDNWQLLGIHHGGGDRLRKLDGSNGFYAANEGIQLTAIRSLFP